MARKRGLERLREAKGITLKDITKGIKPRTKLKDHPEVRSQIRKHCQDAMKAETAKEAGIAAGKISLLLLKAFAASS